MRLLRNHPDMERLSNYTDTIEQPTIRESHSNKMRISALHSLVVDNSGQELSSQCLLSWWEG